MARWTTADIPDLTGRVALITGANSGIGLATARELAAAGATVVLACRGADKAAATAAAIRAERPDARLGELVLDLSDLRSVRTAAAQFSDEHDRLDILCNNAGVLGLPLTRTTDGFELLFGTNHLGHFALTGRLFALLRQTPAARVVTVSSLTHRRAQLPLDDLNWESRPYRKAAAYGQSKLANLLFAQELDRRIRAAGLDMRSVAAHPGVAATRIADNMASMLPARLRPLWAHLVAINNRWFAQPAELGALPSLYAATAAVDSGAYIGPDGWFEIRGYPAPAKVASRARDPQLATALWQRSEELTGVSFP